MDEITVLLEDLPYDVKGFTRANPDMSFTIVLNARLSHEELIQTYLHELSHIVGGDFYRLDMTAGQIEAARR